MRGVESAERRLVERVGVSLGDVVLRETPELALEVDQRVGDVRDQVDLGLLDQLAAVVQALLGGLLKERLVAATGCGGGSWRWIIIEVCSCCRGLKVSLFEDGGARDLEPLAEFGLDSVPSQLVNVAIRLFFLYFFLVIVSLDGLSSGVVVFFEQLNRRSLSSYHVVVILATKRVFSY